MTPSKMTLAGPAILFCPADRPDRYAKAMERADSVIVDLEDAVTPEQKQAAREHLRAWCEDPKNHTMLTADPVRFIVRVNSPSSEFFADDMQILQSVPVQIVMLPKTESPEDVDRLVAELPEVAVVALCESAAGVARSLEIARHPAVVAMMWGAEDLLASIGGFSSRLPDGRYRDVARAARATVLLHASASGKASIDSINTDFSDTSGLAEEARDASDSGFTFKACIHPAQCGIIRQAYAPTPEEVRYARDLLAAVNESRGAVNFRGTMVDDPLIRHAENLLRRSGAS
ncbi:putative citrate lyase beta chain [Arthrobacter crystallopoietes BAB-32]|uniref:Putative citrate lyase beta chain n=1 Tax=Arthrobacter crystallopoietes BAB-32 TaxID=1246476 RepID=N1V2F2_9MICC|nr:CoA ester lyase [Arthrobacter crystallopoietes]EMY35530.1 putative citrate lyase beta chain [Arthrobacter crystallopoietes BAB-32]